MPGFLSSAGESHLLDLLTQATGAYPTYFIALVLDKPVSRHQTGEELDEPLQVDYQRAAYVNASGNWSGHGTNQVTNTQDIVFPICTSDWGTIKYWAICTDQEAGLVLFAGALLTPVTAKIGDQVTLPAGTLTLRSSGYLTSVVL
jgi:hypothetical protein